LLNSIVVSWNSTRSLINTISKKSKPLEMPTCALEVFLLKIKKDSPFFVNNRQIRIELQSLGKVFNFLAGSGAFETKVEIMYVLLAANRSSGEKKET
jgi:hypothetical protein